MKTCIFISAKAEDKPAEPAKPTPSPNDLPATTNKKTYHARLGLARASAKNTDDLTEAKKFYNEVIDIAPEVSSSSVRKKKGFKTSLSRVTGC